jgi:hypothetical protein
VFFVQRLGDVKVFGAETEQAIRVPLQFRQSYRRGGAARCVVELMDSTDALPVGPIDDVRASARQPADAFPPALSGTTRRDTFL